VKRKRLSVCVCTYNGAKYLREQLQSIKHQSQIPDEVIIADDGSTDRTLDLINEFASEVTFAVKIIRSDGDPLGVTKNFERALNVVTGEIIVLSDQDDIWHVDRLRQIIRVFVKYPKVAYLFSNASIIDHQGKPHIDSLWDRIGFGGKRAAEFQHGNQLSALLCGDNFTYGMSMAIQHKILDKILPINSQSVFFTHDVWIAVVLSALGHHGFAVQECLVSYRQHTDQIAGAGHRKVNQLRSVYNSLKAPRYFDCELPLALNEAALRVKQLAPSTLGNNSAVELILGKAEHLRRREAASKINFSRRLLLISKELFTGRYNKFSNSIGTALRDLIG